MGELCGAKASYFGDMNRRAFLKAAGSGTLASAWPNEAAARAIVQRRRPSEANWPSAAAWKRLKEAVNGHLIPIVFPLAEYRTGAQSAGDKRLFENLKNPYYIGDQPGLTQTLGWVDAWATKASAYAVAAESASDISAAVHFARENDLRLVIKGGGHSYQGTSNAPIHC